MKVSKLTFCLLTAIAAALPYTAHADTCAQGDNLLACIQGSTESCRASAGCSTDREQALSAQDVLEEAATLCCSKRNPNRCLNNFSNRLKAANRAAPVVVKTFLGKARREVLALKSNGCDTGSLGDI